MSSVVFDNKLLLKSLHNAINFNKCEFREKLCEFISLIIYKSRRTNFKKIVGWLSNTIVLLVVLPMFAVGF